MSAVGRLPPQLLAASVRPWMRGDRLACVRRVSTGSVSRHFGHVAGSQVHALFASTMQSQAQLIAKAMLYSYVAAAALSLDAMGTFLRGYSQDPEVVRSFAETGMATAK